VSVQPKKKNVEEEDGGGSVQQSGVPSVWRLAVKFVYTERNASRVCGWAQHDVVHRCHPITSGREVVGTVRDTNPCVLRLYSSRRVPERWTTVR